MNAANVYFYPQIMKIEASIMDASEAVQERLLIYEEIENTKTINLEELQKKSIFSNLLKTGENMDQSRRFDELSHLSLRNAYAKSTDLSYDFIHYEKIWFEKRFALMTNKAQVQFCIDNYILPETDETGLNYRIYVQEASVLLTFRKAYTLRKGYIYLPKSDLIHFVCAKFQRHLIKIMKQAVKDYDKAKACPLSACFKLVRPAAYILRDDLPPINLKNIDEMAASRFPLCKQFIHATLRKTHHLKHHARLEQWTFLRNVKLSYSDMHELFKEEFSRKMGEKQFVSEHAYKIKHVYGMVGHKRPYAANTCDRLIGKSVHGQTHYGCPFKTFDAGKLGDMIRPNVEDEKSIEDVLEIVANGDYKGACTAYFSLVNRKRAPDGGISQPVQYYAEAADIEDFY